MIFMMVILTYDKFIRTLTWSEPINDQELQFFNLCLSLILMTEKEKFPNWNHIFYSFWYALQEFVVIIKFGPVGNPIWRQILRKIPKNREFFFS